MSAGRILVVDDDPQIRRAMKATLTARHYEVSDSRNGEEALDKLRSETYDLVLLDMNMPGMGGIETCRMIRSGSEAAIIMLTVSNTEKIRSKRLMLALMTTSLNLSARLNCLLGFARLCDDCRRPPMTRSYDSSRWKVLKSIFPHGR